MKKQDVLRGLSKRKVVAEIFFFCKNLKKKFIFLSINRENDALFFHAI